MAGERSLSPLILTELYESGDASFLLRLLEYRGSFKPYLGIIEKWKKDRRDFATRMKLQFIESWQLPEHRIIFKRLFKQAWHDHDHDVMGAFLVKCDRMVRRRRGKKSLYGTGASGRHQYLGMTEVLYVKAIRDRSIFSGPTTHYLRRRAWRYFRRLGFSDAESYVKAIAKALARYVDEDVKSGENLLDNWGLMHACFGKSDVLVFDKRHTNIKPDTSLASLQAAPMFERHWAGASGAPVLLDLVLRANCRAVRVWAIQLLKRLHSQTLVKLDATMLLKLLDHSDPDVALFAAELLSDATAVASMPMDTWLAMLRTRNVSMMAAIVEAFRKHVSFDRVTIAQAARMTINVATPVARLGLEILKSRTIRKPEEFDAIASLAGAQCLAMGEEISRFAVPVLNAPGAYRVEQISGFFDSRLLTVRTGAFAAIAPNTPAAMDPAFFARLMEAPYDDVRASLVGWLKRAQSLPGASAESLATLWQTVLLNIHRGGRAKLSALRQISDRIISDPSSLRFLLPVIAIAIRSVRWPEARHGLAAIVTAVEADPSLASEISRYLPELQLTGVAG
jgi:hypothetical protein